MRHRDDAALRRARVGVRACEEAERAVDFAAVPAAAGLGGLGFPLRPTVALVIIVVFIVIVIVVASTELEGAYRYEGREIREPFVFGVEDRCEFRKLVLIFRGDIEGSVTRDKKSAPEPPTCHSLSGAS